MPLAKAQGQEIGLGVVQDRLDKLPEFGQNAAGIRLSFLATR